MYSRWAGLALAVLILFPGRAPAREATRADLEERIRRLERIIEQRGLDKPAPPKAAPEAAAPLQQPEVEQIVEDKLKKQKVLAGWKDGFFLESPNGDFKLKLRGYLQADARFFPLEGGDTGTDSFFLRRVRPIFEGTVYKYFDFRIMPDFGQGTTVLQDAFLDVKYWPYASLRAGKTKFPLSLERLQSGADLLFIERSIANNLAPNRDIGFMLFGNVLDGALTYQLGGFDGTFDGGSVDGDTTSDKEMVGRMFAEPFKNTSWNPVKGLGLGLAGSYGGQKEGDNLSGLAYKTSGRSNFFKFTTSSTIVDLANRNRARFDPQGYYYWGPFGFLGEFISSDQGVQQATTTTVNKKAMTTKKQASFTNTGWTLQASYVLTGEDASYKTVVPINNFDPRQGRWGAFEVAARGSNVRIDNQAFTLGFAKTPDSTRKAWEYGMGVNWYLNKNVKVQANWMRTEFDSEIKFGDHLRDHEDVFLTRFQLSD